MKIFVFEYVTGGGMLDGELPPSLVNEGEMMLRALVGDLAEIEDVEMVTMRDARLGPIDSPIRTVRVGSQAEYESAWRQLLESVDGVWPIAPECGGALYRITRSVVAHGCRLLSCRPDAVRLTTSKLATSAHLQARGLPVVPSYDPRSLPPDGGGQWILKPDDGAGCMGTRICDNRQELFRELGRAPAGQAYVAQPFVRGEPASVSLLVNDGRARVLSTNRQRIVVMDNSFVLLGCVVNGLLVGSERVRALAAGVAAAIPGLWGVIGVDFIIAADDLYLVEVNPRLTTSYVGIKASTGINPAALVLDLLNDDRAVAPSDPYLVKAIDVDVEFLGAA